MTQTIMVVDDEYRLVSLVQSYLVQEGFRVVTAANGLEALTVARRERPELVILDIMMPEMNGYDFMRKHRLELNTPIILLTARVDDDERVIGLELGADDYITKPFRPRELVARVRVAFRRIENATSFNSEMIRVADLTLDVPRMRVTAEKRPVEELTPTEFDLLATLARQPGRIFTRAQLLDAIHGVAFESYERAIDAHIKNIRRKIEVKAGEPRYVLTVYGVGYKFADR